MNNKPLLSLCIPTNGIMNLVKPVIESIYRDQVDEKLFEVVIMDNGDNKEFYDYAQEIVKEHNNFHYYHTDKKGFLNEFESYRKANGEFIKFINHRTKLNEGTLECFVNFVKENVNEKPAIYFSNGTLKEKDVFITDSFDKYVRKLGLWNTWSTGMAFWKSDFDKLSLDNVNELFPHATILFGIHNKSTYIVNDSLLLDEIHVNHANKGKYDLYYAFLVDFNNLTSGLLKENLITKETFKKIKKELLIFCSDLYYSFNINGEPCSYYIDNYKDSVKEYYKMSEFKYLVNKRRIKEITKSILRKNK